MEDNCIFCRIARGEIPSHKVYEDETTFAFRDIHPLTPVHVVVVPKRHVAGMNDADQLTNDELAACLRACRCAARAEGVEQSGYRVVTNCGPDAGQTVEHLHFHVLGGARMPEGIL